MRGSWFVLEDVKIGGWLPNIAPQILYPDYSKLPRVPLMLQNSQSVVFELSPEPVKRPSPRIYEDFAS